MGRKSLEFSVELDNGFLDWIGNQFAASCPLGVRHRHTAIAFNDQGLFLELNWRMTTRRRRKSTSSFNIEQDTRAE